MYFDDNVADFKRFVHFMIKVVVAFIMVCGITVLINNNFITFFSIPSQSMYPTLAKGDIGVISRNTKELKRGDIVIYKNENKEIYASYISKRIVGLPGDKIEIKNNLFYRNGVLADDSLFIKEPMDTPDLSVIIPKDTCLLMGDNRNNSNDSRFWDNKFIENHQIIGVIKGVLFPLRNIAFY